VQTLAFNASGDMLVTGDTERYLRAWFRSQLVFEADVRALSDKVRPLDRIRAIEFSSDAKKLYVATGDTLRAFDLVSRTEAWRYIPPRSFGFLIVSPVAAAVSPGGKLLVATDFGNVKVLDEKGQSLGHWYHNDAPRYFSFLLNGTEIVGADGFSVSVFEAYSGRRLRWVRTRERIYGMAYAPFQGIVAVRNLHYIELLDVETLMTLERIPAPTGLPLVAFSPNGGLLAAGGKEEVMLIDMNTKKSELLPVVGARVLTLTFHPGGSTLAAGCSDGVVRFWDVFSGASVI